MRHHGGTSLTPWKQASHAVRLVWRRNVNAIVRPIHPVLSNSGRGAQSCESVAHVIHRG